MSHIDHEAELYALGMLDEAERDRIDAHIATCDACVRKIGAAEAAVAGLADVSLRAPQHRLPRWPLALAACFALAALGLAGGVFHLQGELDRDGTILATMVDSHFEHMQFTTPRGAPLGAKAIYERHGAWYEILADGTPPWHVVLVQPDGTRDLEAAGFARRGASSVMLVRPAAPVQSIELDDSGGHIVGSLRPVLAR